MRLERPATAEAAGLARVVWADAPEKAGFDWPMDARLRLEDREDGVWLECLPAQGGGAPLERREAERYLQRKQLTRLDAAAAARVFEAGIGLQRIAPPQNLRVLDTELEVRLAADHMTATARVLPGDLEGRPLAETEALAALLAAGVRFGVDRAALAALLAAPAGQEAAVARGQLPEPGEPGRLEFHFRTQLTAAPKVIDAASGRVDFRNLDIFEPARAGQLLVTRHPEGPGREGQTVSGRPLSARPGRPAPTPRGKNVAWDAESLHLYAQKSGMVQYINGSVSVSDLYVVKGDCDLGTGNILFEGNVQIGGNVILGMRVQAAGSIVVGGVVEGAALEAGGDIVLHRGMMGVGRGSLKAGGDITAQFIERAEVEVQGNLTSDSILHSTLSVGGTLTVRGRRGMLAGGSAKVRREVIAQVLGAPGGVATVVELGVTAAVRNRLDVLKRQLEGLDEELDKLTKLKAYLEKSEAARAARADLYASVEASLLSSRQQEAERRQELSLLAHQIESAVLGKIHVLDTVYPGVRLTIASTHFIPESPVSFATFYYSASGEIAFLPCQLSRQ